MADIKGAGFDSPPQSIYEIEYTLLSGDVDTNLKLRLPVLFRLFQDIAGLHSNNLGCGPVSLLSDFRAVWVILRTRVEILRLPKLFENIKIRTWPQSPARMYERDFVVIGEDGEPAIRATSLWVIMNVETRELITERILDYGIEVHGERAIPGGAPRRIRKQSEPPEGVYEKTLRFSDIDYNAHANNTKYVELAADIFSSEEMRGMKMKSFEINFDHEAMEGETLEVFALKGADGAEKAYVEALLKESGDTVFRCVFEYESEAGVGADTPEAASK